MFKLGKMTDYGTVVMTALAAAPDALRNAQELAQLTHLAPPTVSKLLKQLVRGGLVESSRGARGGYRLARPPASITVADVVAAFEGPIALTRCAEHHSSCAIESSCGVRGNWRLINGAIRQALEAVTLEAMAAPLRRKAGKKSIQSAPALRPAATAAATAAK
jgi:FeS assembly SUF system regulator